MNMGHQPTRRLTGHAAVAHALNRAVPLIRRVQWGSVRLTEPGSAPASFPACPVCGGIDPSKDAEAFFELSAIGHRGGCEMAAFLEFLAVCGIPE